MGITEHNSSLKAIQVFSPTMVELFCGCKNISRAFSDAGFITFSTDIRQRKGICEPDLRKNILNITCSDLPFKKVNVLYAGIPCTAYSYGAGDLYFKNGNFKKNAAPFLQITNKVLRLVEEINPDFYIFENPRGNISEYKPLRTFLKQTNGEIFTTSLDQFGFPSIKPTFIITNYPELYLPPVSRFGRGNKNRGKGVSDLTLIKKQSTPYKLGEYLAKQIITGLNNLQSSLIA